VTETPTTVIEPLEMGSAPEETQETLTFEELRKAQTELQTLTIIEEVAHRIIRTADQ
jgi:hypothetical protein